MEEDTRQSTRKIEAKDQLSLSSRVRVIPMTLRVKVKVKNSRFSLQNGEGLRGIKCSGSLQGQFLISFLLVIALLRHNSHTM